MVPGEMVAMWKSARDKKPLIMRFDMARPGVESAYLNATGKLRAEIFQP